MRYFIVILLSLYSLANVPSYNDLCKSMSEVENFKSSECDGSNIKSPMGEFVSATKDYKQKDKFIEVSIMSGNMAATAWMPFVMGVSIETNDTIIKIDKINGFKAGINFNKKDKSGAIVLKLSDDAVVSFNFEKMKLDEVLEIVKKYDVKKIKKLFKK